MGTPLVTFALYSYNQERFIRDSVRSALSQTYSPLQVILSDDCSQDRTFEIIQEETANYDGPHQILLNRNDRTLGIGGHMNRIWELAKGEFVVDQAGDDVSLPARTEELVRVWLNGGVFYVHSNVVLVDQDGLGEKAFAGFSPEPVESWQTMIRDAEILGIFGSTQAWDRAVFDMFGPLPQGNIHDDLLVPFRAALLGKVVYIDKPLVRYRRHAASMQKVKKELLQMDSLQYARYQLAHARMYAADYECFSRDIQFFMSTHPESPMNSELWQAVETTADKAKYYKLMGSTLEKFIEGGRLNRWCACWRGIELLKYVRTIGIKALVKICLLCIAPDAFFKLQKWRL